MNLQEKILEDNHRVLNVACDCKFVRELRAGSLSPEAAFSYVVLEAQFVLEAARLVGAAVTNAPDDRSLKEHSGALDELVTGQRPYLEGLAVELSPTGAAADISPASRHTLTALTDRIRGSSDYGRIATVCFATEVFYLRWCESASSAVNGNDHLGDWVRMHTTNGFRRRVEFLGSEVNALSSQNYVQGELSELFRETIQAEIEFHDLVYGTG